MPLFQVTVNTKLSEQQFASILGLLNQIKQLVEKGLTQMGLNFEKIQAQVANLQDDVAVVTALVTELKNKPDNTAEDQAKLDEVAARLAAVDSAFDALTAIPAPAPEPTPATEGGDVTNG